MNSNSSIQGIKSRFSCVLFDLGDTLFEPLAPELSTANLAALCSRCRIAISLSELNTAFARSKTELTRRWRRKTHYRHEDFVRVALNDCLRQYGHSISESELARHCEAQRKSVVETLVPRPDSFATLTKLKSMGLKTGIVSNIDDTWLEPLNKKWGLQDKVDLCLSSESARSCKPNSFIFESACTSLVVDPVETLFVGDSEINDVGGANAMGMTSVLFRSEQELVASSANHQIAAINDVIALVS